MGVNRLDRNINAYEIGFHTLGIAVNVAMRVREIHDSRSVFGRPLYAVDDEHLDCAPARLQFQSELFLYGGEERR